MKLNNLLNMNVPLALVIIVLIIYFVYYAKPKSTGFRAGATDPTTTTCQTAPIPYVQQGIVTNMVGTGTKAMVDSSHVSYTKNVTFNAPFSTDNVTVILVPANLVMKAPDAWMQFNPVAKNITKTGFTVVVTYLTQNIGASDYQWTAIGY